MASFRKRPGGWRAEIVRTIEGRRVRVSETFPTKAHAQAWAIEKEAELLGNKRIGVTGRQAMPGEEGKLLSDAMIKYRKEVSPTKRGVRWEQIRIDKFIREYPSFVSLKINEVGPEVIAQWRDARLKEVQAPSVRREMNILSSIFEIARREWRWIQVNPCRDVRRPPQPKHRQQRISDEDRDKITSALNFHEKPPTEKRQQVAIMFLLSIETGMRSGELVALKWRDTYLPKHYLTITESKNGHRRDIPLSPRAIGLLTLLRGVNDETVFTVSDAERDALFRKYRPDNLKHINYHDTRHEAVTRLARKLDVLELARMIGHRDLKSLMVYYNATASELADKLG